MKEEPEPPELCALLQAFDDIELKVTNTIREKGFRSDDHKTLLAVGS